MRLKSEIDEMMISVPARQFAHVLALATNYAELRKHLQETESKLVRMRGELTKYQAKLTERNRDEEGNKFFTPASVADYVMANPALSNSEKEADNE